MFKSKEKSLLQKAFVRYQEALAEALPTKDELQAFSVSEKAEQKIIRLLYHQKQFYYTLINTASKRVACILIALFLVATVATVSIEALREGFVRFVVETFEKGTSVWFSKEDSGSLSPSPIVPKIPAYLPEGYRLAADMSDELELNVIYERGEAETISYQQVPKGSKITLNTEGVTYERIAVAGLYEGFIFENKGSWYLTFNDTEYMYSIIGTVSKEEILRIAESISFE